MNKIKLMILICVTSLLNGCILFMLADRSPPPMDGWESFRMPKIKNISSEMIKQDMLACGFKNTTNNIGYMSDNEWVLANFCMEEKGYKPGYIGRKMANTICDFEVYQQVEACRNRSIKK